ncbi:MAG: M36 family metallopeptidase [Holophagales bacterium]|nr:M36 family metallopeptidase [Holophagales bacterium]
MDSRGNRALSALVVLLPAFLAFPASAATKAAGPGRGAPPAMADARVNLREAWERAVAARPGVREAGSSRARGATIGVASAIAALGRELPALDVKFSNLTGAPTLVRNRKGALTAAAPGQSTEAIVRGYLGRHASLYGLSAADLGDLVVVGDSAGGKSGLRMLRMEQRVDGRAVFQSETRFLVTRDGRLVGTLGQMVPQARSAAPVVDPSGLLSPAAAVTRLLASVGRTADPASFTVAGETAAGTRLAETDDYVAGPITARPVLFPLAPGVLVPAWSLVVFTGGDADWYAVVDAETGDVLWRKDLRNDASNHDARFRVFVQADGTTPADSPAPKSPSPAVPGSGTQFVESAMTIVRMHAAMSAVASPNGWIDDCPGGGCTAGQTQTLGNNVVACLDRTVGGANTNVCDTDPESRLDGNGRPTGNPDAASRNRDFLGTAPRDFQSAFLPPPQGGDPEAGQSAMGAGDGTSTGPTDIYRRGAVAQLFYTSNWFHDRTFLLGFDEGSGNFQATNFSGSGLGGDPVNADAQDGSGSNNANFSTPPDGTSGRMQMYLFTSPTIRRDGGLDAEVVVHELTHGLTSRIVGNGAGINWQPARALGEGWSDFYAFALLNARSSDDPDGNYATGAWATYKLSPGFDNYVYGIRRFPYSTDNAVNPLTWADVDDVTNDLSGGIAPDPLNFNNGGAMEVHNAGELWAISLWEVRSRVIADPAGAAGNVPAGNETMLQLVTDALKLTPADPSFTDARDALVDADCATNACANETSIWAGFADRGLGYGARAPYGVLTALRSGHLGVQESFVVPHLDVANPTTDVTVDDSATNGNGALDPGETVRITVKLTNPWRGAAKGIAGATATLASLTPGVSVWSAASTYGSIPPTGTATGEAFLISVAPTVACGAGLDFSLTTVSSLGTTTATFKVRVGTRNGTGPLVFFTRDTSPDLAIPDYAVRGVTDQLTITDDLEIADLDFRVDGITHAFAGDLVLMLRSPSGVGTDLVSLIGWINDEGNGANLTNMVLDDDLPVVADNDMTQALATDAPYAKAWLPVFNAPWPPLKDLPGPDPVGSLSRFDGGSTKGTWTLLASDQKATRTGTLHAWSLLVTPVRFDCASFAGTVAIAATKSVSGTYLAGQSVTYTIVLTNGGTSAQADNAGNELTDILPAGLTLVSATATSGTAVATIATNTVTWNGALAPFGGTVTITIAGTIGAASSGQTVSNQATVSFDADGNGSNEATVLTDDPSVAGASDPTTFHVGGATLSATKSAGGLFQPGTAVVYTIVVANSGNAASPDSGTHELTDVLPPALALVSATATSGTAVASVATNTATWDGSVPAGGSVTVTVTATILNAPLGTPVTNQAGLLYDADLDGTSETTALSDDPGVSGASDPTEFLIQRDAALVPTVSGFGLLALALGVLAVAWSLLRLRS